MNDRFIGTSNLVFGVLDENGNVKELKKTASNNINLEEKEEFTGDSVVYDPNGGGEFSIELSEGDIAIWKTILTGKPSLRVLRLANHAKKKRTRKKNINRLIKYWKSIDK